MGRGVEVRAGAEVVVYADWDLTYENWFAARTEDGGIEPDTLTEELFYDDHDARQWEWEGNLDWFMNTCSYFWPSLEPIPGGRSSSGYYDRETLVYLENQYVEVGVSEYCGMTALTIWIKPDEGYDGDPQRVARAKGWVKAITPKFERTFGTYYKIGTFSNGESVYGTKKDEEET